MTALAPGVGQGLAILVLGDGLGDFLGVGVDKVDALVVEDDKLAARDAGKLLVTWVGGVACRGKPAVRQGLLSNR